MNNYMVKRQEIAFRVDVKDGIVQKIHNAYIYQPRICFKSEDGKSYEDSGGK